MARVVCFLFPLVNNWLISWFERLRHLIRWFLKWDVPLVLDPLSILLQCRQIAAKVSPLLTLSKSFHTTDFNLLELTITASSVISIRSQLDLLNKGNTWSHTLETKSLHSSKLADKNKTKQVNNQSSKERIHFEINQIPNSITKMNTSKIWETIHNQLKLRFWRQNMLWCIVTWPIV